MADSEKVEIGKADDTGADAETTTAEPTARAAGAPASGEPQPANESAGPAADARNILSRKLIGVAAAAVVLLAAVTSVAVYYFVQNGRSEGVLAAQQEAREAACAYGPVLADYDSANLEPYFAAVLDGATGDWKSEFEDTSKELRTVLAEGEVVSKVEDVQCAIKSGDESSAEAIVVIGQTITSVGTQGQPARGQLSMVLRMSKTDGKWLVNDVNSPLATTPPVP